VTVTPPTTSWWQTVLGWGGVVVAAIITSAIAYRAARKTPFETLKTLVDVLDKSDHVLRQDRHILETAVHRALQLERIRQLTGVTARWTC
jgi:hypothetical protein